MGGAAEPDDHVALTSHCVIGTIDVQRNLVARSLGCPEGRAADDVTVDTPDDVLSEQLLTMSMGLQMLVRPPLPGSS
jgi:hypothetical protein